MVDRTGFSLQECVDGLMKNINLITKSLTDKYGNIDNMPEDILQFMTGLAHTLLSLRNEK
jgi:hypothetical protein